MFVVPVHGTFFLERKKRDEEWSGGRLAGNGQYPMNHQLESVLYLCHSLTEQTHSDYFSQ